MELPSKQIVMVPFKELLEKVSDVRFQALKKVSGIDRFVLDWPAVGLYTP